MRNPHRTKNQKGVSRLSNVIVLPQIVPPTEIEIREWQGQRVVTLADIDRVHRRPEGTARRNFNENKGRFIVGEDYFELNQAYEFRQLCWERPQGGTPEKMILMTESGYLMIVKSLTDDLAWQVQRSLVNTYFRVQESNRFRAIDPVRLLPNISPLTIPPDLPEPLRLVLSATEQAKQAEETEQIDSWISLIADGIDKDLRVAYRRDFVHAGAWLCRNYPWGWDSLVRRLRNSKAVAGWSIRDWREEIDDAVREMDTAQLIRELPDWMTLPPQDLQYLLLSKKNYSLIARQGVEWFITLAAEFLDQIYGSDDPTQYDSIANMLYACNIYQPASRKLKHRVIREQLHAVYLRTHSRQDADLTVGAVWPDAPALIHEWPLPVKSIMGRNYSWTYDDRTISQILGVEENGRPTLRMILSVPMFIVSVQRVPNPKMPSQQFEQLTFVWRTPTGQWVRQNNSPVRLLGTRVTSWLAYQGIASAKSPIFIRDWFYSQRAMVASRLFDSEDAFRDLPLI